MTTVRATVDLTVRRTVVFDFEATNALPSRIGQIIQESIVAVGDDDVVFHSVSWEEVQETVSDTRCGAGIDGTFCDKQSGHPSDTHYDSAMGVAWTDTTDAPV